MKSQRLMTFMVVGALFGCSTPQSLPAWPSIEGQRGAYGGWEAGGLGISIHCNFTSDPQIFYFVVTRKHTGSDESLFKGGAEVFLVHSLESIQTPDGESPLVLLGEFHSATQLVFAMGATESIGAAAAAQFQAVLPPAAVPSRLSSKSPVALQRLAVLLGTLTDA